MRLRLCCFCRGITHAELVATPQLLLLCSRLLESPPAFAVRYKPLMLRLLGPLQHNFNLLNPEQMAQVGVPGRCCCMCLLSLQTGSHCCYIGSA
jgi:hypothetical protein